MQENLAGYLGLISGILIIPVYLTYFLQVKKGHSTPNPATWFIWLLVMILNGATYVAMVGNNLKSFIAIIVPIAQILMFVYLTGRKKFAKIGKTDVLILVLVFIIGIFWKITNNPKLSNLLLQTIILFSFWPTAKGLIWGSLKERPTPWMIATLVYLFTIIANLIDYNGLANLVYPVINGIIGNGSIGVIAIIKNSGRQSM